MMVDLNGTKENMVNHWVKNQPQILFLLIVVIAVSFLRQLPYFNFIFTFSAGGIILWLISALLFNLKSKSSVVAAVVALLTTGFATAIEKTAVAQEAGNFAYYVALIAFIQVLLETRNEKRKIG